VAGANPWVNRDFLRGTQYKTDANLAARQSIYAYQHPRVDLAARVLDLAAPAPSDTIVDVGCGNGMYLAELAKRSFAGRVLGIDLSFGMLAAARDRLRRSQARRTREHVMVDGCARYSVPNHPLSSKS
jgi:SAM-dependent methyltransferase